MISIKNYQFSLIDLINTKKTHIHLLLLSETDRVDASNKATMASKMNATLTRQHYCWLKNLGTLIGQQVSANEMKKVFCDRCLNHFNGIYKLEAHMWIYFGAKNNNILLYRQIDTFLTNTATQWNSLRSTMPKENCLNSGEFNIAWAALDPFWTSVWMGWCSMGRRNVRSSPCSGT